MEFTKGKWVLVLNKRRPTLIEVRNEANKLVCELENYERNKQIMSLQELKSNALLISKAPEMLEELKETLIDLKILRNQIIDANKTNHLFDGMSDLTEKWIERKEQLIKEATEL